MDLDGYRIKINSLDALINSETDKERKIELIDEDIKANSEYIALLKKPLPVKIVFCVILSFVYLLGLMIFLPQIIVRKTKIRICNEKIMTLSVVKEQILKELSAASKAAN